MLWPFRKKNTFHPDDIVYEKWGARFNREKNGRFESVQEPSYTSGYTNGQLILRLEKKQHFAWVNDPLYRYRDFSLEAEIEIGRDNGHSAAGFLFRYVNEENYYYFLVSNRGYFRFDLVFNGNPMSLIPWTEFPMPEDPQWPIRILCRGSLFYFFVDNTWIGEVENEGIDAGGIAFAGQNYDERDKASFSLHKLLMESRPVEVEKSFFRWTRYIPADPDRRSKLAESFYRQGQFTAAVIQLKKISRARSLICDEYLMLGDSCINLNLPEEALSAMEKALSLDQHNVEACIGKANALYTLNRYIELKEYLQKRKKQLDQSSVLQNLLGNTEYSLGNFEAAAAAYKKALSLEPEMPIFLMNAARALERIEEKEEAMDLYVEAARQLYAQQAFEDLFGILNYILSASPENEEMLALKGKVLFQEEKYGEAEKIFEELIEKGCEDSAVLYLSGLLALRKGDREKGYLRFKKAVELEDDFPLYWRKLAETDMLLSLPAEISIQKTLELSPEEPWALNLAGQYYIERGESGEALAYLEQAWSQKPEEVDILLNYSEALFQNGKRDEAIALLEKKENDPAACNLAGNHYAAMGRYEDSLASYEKALEGDRENPLYKENYASVCLELDLLNRAEEILVPLLDTNPTGRIYNLLGNTVWIKGEHLRAEEIFKKGMEEYPQDSDVALNYGELLFQRGRCDEAAAIADRVLKSGESPRAEKLKNRVFEKTHVVLSCATCDRTWTVKKDIPAQGVLKLVGDPPEEAPAGKCPSCGKIYCIGCEKDYLEDSRFICPECGENLKLSDDHLKFILKTFLSKEE